MLYSEIFVSPQGEGLYTGVPSVWLRMFLCNLTCDGFSQEDPTDPSSYELPWKTIDVEDVTAIDEMPVFSKGCDSSYSWAKKFKHLQHKNTPAEVCDLLGELLPQKGMWKQLDGPEFDMIFTGGEPLLGPNQKNIEEMLGYWKTLPENQRPKRFTFETNGTQKITDSLFEAFNEYQPEEVLMSYSPKLFTVSGEENKKAVKPDVIQHNLEFIRHFGKATYKFVLTPEVRAWEELERVIDELGIDRNDVWIMPVGGTVEGQKLHDGDVADMAVERGYKIAARVHAYLYGNQIGK